MENLTQFFSQLMSKMGPEIGNVLITLIILVAGVFLAKLIAKFCGNALNKLRLNERLRGESQQNIDFVKNICSLVYYVVILNVVLIVLERLNITSVLEPLKNLSDQFLGALPRVIGAGIIFYAGWVIAKLCAGFVEIAATKIDQYLEKKNYNPDFKISKFLSAFVLGGFYFPSSWQDLTF